MLTVEAIGYIGNDAIIREYSDKKFISFSIAHTERFTDNQGVKHERTTWLSCMKYGSSNILPYLKKGTCVFVRGDLSAKIYDLGSGPSIQLNCLVKEIQLVSNNKTNTTATEHPAPVQSESVKPPFEDSNDDLPF